MKKLNYYLIIFLAILSVLNYSPFINFNISIIIYILFIILGIVNISNILKILRKKYMLLIPIIAIIIYYGLMYQFDSYIYLNDLYSIVLSSLLLLVFLSVRMSDIDKNRLLYVISFSVIVITIIYIFVYGNTILLSESYIEGQYFFKSKNGMGPIISFATFWFLYNYINKDKKIINLIMYILGFVSLAIIKARTSLLAICIVTIFIVFRYLKLNLLKRVIYAFLFIIVCILFWENISEIILKAFNVDFIMSSVSGSLNTNSFLDLILSGRLEHYKFGLELFSDNPILGSRFNTYSITGMITSNVGIHSFFIRSLAYGGIVYFLLILFLIFNYLYYFNKNNINKQLVRYVLIIGGIGMLFEPIAPFGPGTSYFLFWLLLGLYTN